MTQIITVLRPKRLTRRQLWRLLTKNSEAGKVDYNLLLHLVDYLGEELVLLLRTWLPGRPVMPVTAIAGLGNAFLLAQAAGRAWQKRHHATQPAVLELTQDHQGHVIVERGNPLNDYPYNVVLIEDEHVGTGSQYLEEIERRTYALRVRGYKVVRIIGFLERENGADHTIVKGCERIALFRRTEVCRE